MLMSLDEIVCSTYSTLLQVAYGTDL